MLKKLIQYSGYLLTLIIIVFLLVNTWFANQAIQYKDGAAQYIETVMHRVVKWEIEPLQTYFDEHAKLYYQSTKGRESMALYSKLGKLNTLEPYQYTGSTIKKSGQTQIMLLNFSMLGHFEEGDGLITLTVSVEDDVYYLHQINVNSNVLIKN